MTTRIACWLDKSLKRDVRLEASRPRATRSVTEGQLSVRLPFRLPAYCSSKVVQSERPVEVHRHGLNARRVDLHNART